MRENIEHLRRHVTASSRSFAIAAMSCMLATLMFVTVLTLNLVTVVDAKGQTHTVLTTSREPDAILRGMGMEPNGHDQVTYTTNGMGGASIVVNDAIPIILVVDGQERSLKSAASTVGDLLLAEGIALGEYDYTEPALTAGLVPGIKVVVNRVAYQERMSRYAPYQADVDAYAARLLAETGEALITSKSGVYDVLYRDKLVNGTIAESEILSLTAVTCPFDPPIPAFEDGVAMSTIDGFAGFELGPDGKPTTYKSLMGEAVCTAYWSTGGLGAGGQGLYCGTVAVNPNVIPYGSKLYITSADNTVVYGYAIASDTGIAMMDGRVDIDLYFETYEEAARFGKMALQVYILE